jgi:hypothetical protein
MTERQIVARVRKVFEKVAMFKPGKRIRFDGTGLKRMCFAFIATCKQIRQTKLPEAAAGVWMCPKINKRFRPVKSDCNGWVNWHTGC